MLSLQSYEESWFDRGDISNQSSITTISVIVGVGGSSESA